MTDLVLCGECNGTGTTVVPDGASAAYLTRCSACDGSGEVPVDDDEDEDAERIRGG